MKKLLYSVPVLFLAFVSCKNNRNEVPITDIILSPNGVITRLPDETFTFNATILPNNATNQKLIWISLTDSIASVKDGVVTALKSGVSSIIATTVDGVFVEERTFRVAIGCNTSIPNFGASLGTVTFATDSTWTISGNGISQTWSDAVQTSNCSDKTTYRGGSPGNFNADCRSNPNQKGDLFSWCAIMRFRETLCSAPWRMPSQQDFVDLDIALGGDGINRNQQEVNGHSWETQLTWYLNRWGSTYGGFCTSEGSLVGQRSGAFYWSTTERNASGAHTLYSGTDHIFPQSDVVKSIGFTVRCVR
jgi:uncharacterized protein (TIGR02145 family)